MAEILDREEVPKISSSKLISTAMAVGISDYRETPGNHTLLTVIKLSARQSLYLSYKIHHIHKGNQDYLKVFKMVKSSDA